MIYYFIGQPSAGKTTLAKELHNFLKTEKRNWRQNVFHIDGDDLRNLYKNKDYSESGRRTNIKNAQALITYLHYNGCDVVVSIVSPYLDLREKFKKQFAENIVEFYVNTTEKRERDHFHVKDFQKPEVNFINVDTTKDSPKKSFSKIINHLINLKKL